MGRIDYKAIFEQNQDEWKALTRNPQKYEALLSGHYSDSNLLTKVWEFRQAK